MNQQEAGLNTVDICCYPPISTEPTEVHVKTANKLEPLIQRVSPVLRHSIWRATVKTSLAIGTLTAGVRVLPDFLLVGTQRGGTTTLYKHLTLHPRVKPAGLSKGVHFFDMNFQRGESWYRGHFHTRMRRRGRSESERIITGEASPYYMFHPLAPQRMASVIPEAKLIVLVRDPAERAFSHYRHEVARGFESLPFQDALDVEDQRLAGEHEKLIELPGYASFAHQHHSYLARGKYHEQISRLLDHFPREQVLIMESHDLFFRPNDTYEKVLQFLGLEPFALSSFEHLNPAPRHSQMEPSTRKFLNDYFHEYDQALADLLGGSPSWTTPSVAQDGS